MIGWDHLARAWVVAHRLEALDGVMWALSAVGRGGMVWLAIAAVVAWRRSRWSDFAALAVALLMATAAADYALKPAIGRARPFAVAPAVRVIGGKPHDASFPSGHAANAFAGAFVVSTAVPSGRLVWWPLAVAIAYSRVYLGVHYPLDVIGGALVGVSCAAFVAGCRARFRRRSAPDIEPHQPDSVGRARP
jgi:undecaprenyl-diphosphatase